MLTGSNGGSLHDHISAADLDKPAPPTLPPMRLFVVHRWTENRRVYPAMYDSALEWDVMLHAHSFAPDTAGIIHFYEYSVEWVDDRWAFVSYCRRSFKVWDDVEEIRTADGGVN